VRAALAVTSTLLTLVAVEVVLRGSGFTDQVFTSPDPILGYSLTPGLEQWQSLEGEALIVVNQNGCRGPARPKAKPPATVRVAVLGDSLTEGRQVGEDETYAALAEAELGACPALAATAVEVLNFGVAGYSTVHELLMYRHRARQWAPDIVVLMVYAPNDLDDNTVGARARHQPYFELAGDRLVLVDDFRSSFNFRRRTSFAAHAYDAAKRHVRLLHLGGAALRGYRNLRAPTPSRPSSSAPLFVDSDGTFAPPREPPMVAAWRLLERLIVELASEVEANGAAFILANAPSPHAVHPDLAYRQAVADFYHVPDLDYSERRLAELASAQGFAFMPLAAVMRTAADASGQCLSGFDNAVPCFGHWNQSGHRIVGAVLADAICSSRSSGGPRSGASAHPP
jgi:hypothetical protein